MTANCLISNGTNVPVAITPRFTCAVEFEVTFTASEALRPEEQSIVALIIGNSPTRLTGGKGFVKDSLNEGGGEAEAV